MSINYVDPSTGSLTSIAGTPAKVVNSISNPNLLDNAWFTINQRNILQYSNNSYGVDRWKSSVLTNRVAEVTSDGIKISSTSNGSSPHVIYQCIDVNEKKLKGKQITVSCKIKNISSDTIAFLQMRKSDWSIITSGAFIRIETVGYHSFTITIPDDTTDLTYIDFELYSITEANKYITVEAVKLELGSVSTLANDVAPNYQQELAKCQRYYYELNNNNGAIWMPLGLVHFRTANQCCCLLPLPVPMRSAPTVLLNLEATTISYPIGAATDVTPTAASTNSTNPYAVSLTLSVTETATVNTCGELWLKTGTAGKISFSADL